MESIQILSSIANSTKAAAAGSCSAIGGSIYAAATAGPNVDPTPIVAGVALGVVGLGWSIYAAGRDRRVATLVSQMELLQRLFDQQDERREKVETDLRAELAGAEKIRRRLIIDNAGLAGRVARLEGESGEKSTLDTPEPDADL